MAMTVNKTCKKNSNSELENEIIALTEEFRMNQSEYNVKQSITIKSGCITNRYTYENKRLFAVYCCKQAAMERLSCCS